ncbi:cation diffusion facilitator family transporter [Pseudobacteroides cellulosolvens]|uniref:Cation diffusion facilitator family transporter n=1 Tax=Pseudobacteroides cellulosolvens ATCC 35603 = DSM 2933 TaxID=398512 RepID=A0A0L6JU15_9FIRM|nr:cation diffusion facilitator family transporter [Pseudobacteroides cellulosolvens]KNY29194.1 cation diffusion facilitator family transporter [Pseudobacteroides cellulosolvens ATCC 35603 = DSM 2933]
MENQYDRIKIGERGARISIFAYIILSVFKLITGYLSESEALTADGLNNSTDIIASLAVLIGLKISRKPADENHHYGHWRAETVSSLIASLIMIGVGLNVLYNAIRSIINFKAPTPDITAAIVGIICAGAIYLVYLYNKKIALSIKSSALMAAAKDNLSDAWVSVGTSIGIIASQFGLAWIDPAAAIVVGILICKTGWDIFREAAHNLTDGFDKKSLDNIFKIVCQVPGVLNVKNVRGRVYGNNIMVDVSIIVDASLNISQGHKITEDIESHLKSKFDVIDAVVHIEPDK